MKVIMPIQQAVFDMAGTTLQDHQVVERCFLKTAQATGFDADTKIIRPMVDRRKPGAFETL